VLALFNAPFSVSKIKVFHCTLPSFEALLAPTKIGIHQRDATTQKEHKHLRNLKTLSSYNDCLAHSAKPQQLAGRGPRGRPHPTGEQEIHSTFAAYGRPLTLPSRALQWIFEDEP
jgi:hypothetical protein